MLLESDSVVPKEIYQNVAKLAYIGTTLIFVLLIVLFVVALIYSMYYLSAAVKGKEGILPSTEREDYEYL
jgi:uncharacterized membrane protein YukC